MGEIILNVFRKMKRGTKSTKAIEKYLDTHSSNNIRTPKKGARIIYHAQKTFK